MPSHNFVFVILMTSCFLLRPADAGLKSWITEKAGKPCNQLPESEKGICKFLQFVLGGTTAMPAVSFKPVTFNAATGPLHGGTAASPAVLFNPVTPNAVTGRVYVNWFQSYASSVYNVKIQKWTEGTDDCLENIVITQQERGERTLKGRCVQYSAPREIRNSGDLLLIGNLDDDRVVFTSNRSELFYFQEGKWRRGEFNDSTRDRDLTSAEADGIRERIKNWQALFVKHDRAKGRIRALRETERKIFTDKRSRIREGRQEARRNHKEAVDKIMQSRSEERKEHALKKKNIYKSIRTEGKENLEKLLIEEEERHNKKITELEEMRDNEDKNYEQALQEIDEKVSQEEQRKDRELSRLYALEDEEEKKMAQEVEEKIKQGW